MIYNYLNRNERESFQTECKDWKCLHSIPKHDPDADINVIFKKTQLGQHVGVAKRNPSFGDFSNTLPYDQMLEQIQEAQDVFMSLPADERRKYKDDPKNYYDEKFREAVRDAELDAKHRKEIDDEKAKADELAKAKKLLNVKE